MIKCFVLAIGFLFCTTARAIAGGCHDDPRLVGACFAVHGRVHLQRVTVLFWPVGTKRMFQVGLPGEKDAIGESFIPKNVMDQLSAESAVFGDFVVCPYTPDRPGVLGSVCIDSATNLVTGMSPSLRWYLQHREELNESPSPAGTRR